MSEMQPHTDLEDFVELTADASVGSGRSPLLLRSVTLGSGFSPLLWDLNTSADIISVVGNPTISPRRQQRVARAGLEVTPNLDVRRVKMTCTTRDLCLTAVLSLLHLKVYDYI